jgi:glutathione S-transferase
LTPHKLSFADAFQVPVSDLRLITIPISHFCEKARWALELAELPYREERHLQVIHWAHVWRAGHGWTAPVLVTPKGALRESAQIVRFADARAGLGLYRNPLAAALEARFDARLGPDARAWMYERMLGRPDLMRAYGASGVPRWERAGMPVMMPLMRRAIVRRADADEEHAAAARGRVRLAFDDVAARLDDGRPYLCGEHFTAADLAFAALAAAVLVPPRYGVPLPQPDELPAPFDDEVRGMRAHPAGQFALRLYDQERP